MKISIIGGTNGMGKSFANFFKSKNQNVVVHNSSSDNWDEIKTADLVIISVPKKVFKEVTERIKPLIKNQPVASFSSYMSGDIKYLEDVTKNYLFIHALFGPDIEISKNQKIVFSDNNDAKVTELKKIFIDEGLEVTEMSPQEHDKLMMYVQALSQFNSMSLAKTLRDSGFSQEQLDKVSTITFGLNRAVIDRLVIQKPELWANIQFSNDDFTSVLDKHLESMNDLIKIAQTKDVDEFSKDFKKTQEFFASQDKEFSNPVVPDEEKFDFNNSIAVLGPSGTYSHKASEMFDDSKEKVFFNSIHDTFQAVEKDKIKIAVLPLENSIHGTVLDTIDLLQKSESKIIDEIIVDIHHATAALLPNQEPESVTEIYSHPQALAQCKKYIKKNFPNAKLNIMPSTSSGFKKIKDEGLSNAVAIGSEFAAKKYGLNIIDTNIEDVANNQTLFVVISKEKDARPAPHTYIALNPVDNYPGLLHSILSIFKDLGINLDKIESRPQRQKLGSYTFHFKLNIKSDDERFSKLTSLLEQSNIPINIMSS